LRLQTLLLLQYLNSGICVAIVDVGHARPKVL